MNLSKLLLVFGCFLSVFMIAAPLTRAQQAPCDGIQHLIQPNENLFRISLNYQVPMSVVAAANGIADPTQIYVGNTLCIPTQAAPPVTTEIVSDAPVPAPAPAETSTGTYFRSCTVHVDCTPSQTQYQVVNGQEVCVAVQETPIGWGWVLTDRIWCRWVDIARNGGEAGLPAPSGNAANPGAGFVSTDGCDDPAGDLFGMINAFRTNLGLGSLSVDERLIAAAKRHATDMYTNRFLSHLGTDGSNVMNRTVEAGYDWIYVYEDIGAGFTSADSMFSWWLGSYAHRMTLISPNITQMGFCRKGNYWTLVLARP